MEASAAASFISRPCPLRCIDCCGRMNGYPIQAVVRVWAVGHFEEGSFAALSRQIVHLNNVNFVGTCKV